MSRQNHPPPPTPPPPAVHPPRFARHDLTEAQKLNILNQITGGEDWEFDDDIARYEGEHADGEPSWMVWEPCGGLVLSRTLGWYEQQGDATWDSVFTLARAMDKASVALNAALRTADEGEAP